MLTENKTAIFAIISITLGFGVFYKLTHPEKLSVAAATYAQCGQPVLSGSVKWVRIQDSCTSPTVGFACKCDNASGTPTWKGRSSNSCSSPSPNLASPFPISSVPGHSSSTLQPPTGACCQKIPNVSNTSITGLMNCS